MTTDDQNILAETTGVVDEASRRLCLEVYARTNEYLRSIELPSDKFGFEILMGPPYSEPPIAFIGYQPGDWKLSVVEAREAGYERCWVTKTCQYATEPWRLADELRNIFKPDLLATCVGLNAIFVRAKRVAIYEELPLETRRLIREFCRDRVKEILNAIRPQKIVVIGLNTFDLFGKAQRDLVSTTTRDHRTGAFVDLTRTGHVGGRIAIATKHLSGAHISSADRKAIAQRLRSFCGTN